MNDRVEPHDTLDEVRDFLRSLPNGGPDDLARKVTAALYAERSNPARDAKGWSDMGTAPKATPDQRAGPRVMGWGRYEIALDEGPEIAVTMQWHEGDWPGWYSGPSPYGRFDPRMWQPAPEGPA